MSPTDETLEATYSVCFRTSNSTVYEVQPGLWLAAPVPGALDDQATATENRTATEKHLLDVEHPIVMVILIDRYAGQTRGARKVHGAWGLGSVDRWVAVQGTPLSRAIISFFSRLSRPVVPLQVAATLDEALEIARARLPDLGWPAS